MIACIVVRPWYWPEGNHNSPRQKAKGHYGCSKVNTKAIPLQTTINVFTNWLLGSALNPEFNQAIIGFTRPLWALLHMS